MNIEIKNLSATYDDVPVLHDVSIKISEGRFTGIIGPNGCGKSTLLRCLYRGVQHTNGEILINNSSIAEKNHKQLARDISVLMQHNNKNLALTVEEIVLTGRFPYKSMFDKDTPEDYKIAHRMMDHVGVMPYKDVYISTLSGGMQQRAMLARTLTQETPCILLDEPTNHLDITYQLQIMDLISKHDATVLAAIHDLNLAALYCDELIAMKDGKIVVAGPTESILTSSLVYDLYHVNAEILQHKGRPIVVYEKK